MGKMRGKDGLIINNKQGCGVKVKKVSEKGRSLMDFGEK